MPHPRRTNLNANVDGDAPCHADVEHFGVVKPGFR
jgi:hypothetical protein